MFLYRCLIATAKHVYDANIKPMALNEIINLIPVPQAR